MKTKKEILSILEKLDIEQHLTWLLDLGQSLTISARSGYPIDGEPGSVKHLKGFNEMQHRVYGRMQHLRSGTAWPLEDFLDGLVKMAPFYGIEGDFGAAFRWAMDRLERRLDLDSPTPPSQ